MLYPLTFQPLFKERVWGGRKIEELYSKMLPAGVPIGESWEISDHGQDVSVIDNGPLRGKTLRWLMEQHATDLLGAAKSPNGRFPLLIKILDAREKLSLQVHPPPAVAPKLRGEPKTEMWFIADADPGAELYVGLKRGVTRAEFERRIADGTVAESFHRIAVKPGDAMFLPSGRVHAIGGGLVIFEIQQNSDTTYRVFDWNRVGFDGKPRELHVARSLASINFSDFEPALVPAQFEGQRDAQKRPLVRDPLFAVDAWRLKAGKTMDALPMTMQIIGVLTGTVEIRHAHATLLLRAGQFSLLPACLDQVAVIARDSSTFLLATAGPT